MARVKSSNLNTTPLDSRVEKDRHSWKMLEDNDQKKERETEPKLTSLCLRWPVKSSGQNAIPWTPGGENLSSLEDFESCHP
ncbi:hypothetical protein CEXT_190581 [Caerostris extrusa]|uniref:Prolactin receptor n=1 Tax=Caerostris extrusa TaxID=172846 RepID=A0AAV4MHP8_CAEEX|nr:hypothetical protein CEXT_190581 [Caerostris extrusa]